MFLFSDELSTEKDLQRIFKYGDLRFKDLIACFDETLDASSSEKQAMIDNEVEIKELQLKLSIIDYNYKLFIEYLNTDIFSMLDFELVIYDEIEYFKDFDDPEFNYPYMDRKS
jgi:hypothetical protein